MSLSFPKPLSASEWRERWKASGLFREETGASMHDRVWWSTPGVMVTVHHTPYGHGAGGRATMVIIERVVFEERPQRAGPSRTVTWSGGELGALELAWLPSEVRPVIERLFGAAPARAIAAPATRSAGGWTPLHDACDRGHVERVEQLLASGADASARSPAARASTTVNRLVHGAGSTPLHVAAWIGSRTSPFMVRALLARGADVNVRDDAGATVADRLGSGVNHAGALVFAELVPLLVEAGASFDVAALGAVQRMNGLLLLALAQSGFDFDRPLDGGASLRARLAPIYELQWKKKRTVLNAASKRSAAVDQ